MVNENIEQNEKPVVDEFPAFTENNPPRRTGSVSVNIEQNEKPVVDEFPAFPEN